MIIGLTGQIGSGKSEAARVFKRLGAVIVDADLIGREVVDNSPQLRRKLAREFGREILDRSGRVKRRKLAALAFVTKSSRDKLNRIVHPYLLTELRRQVKAALKTHEVVVIDAALLLFWKMDREVDLVLVIHSSRESRIRRMKKRGITPEDALARERAQLPYQEFRKRADRLILNNGSLKDLQRKLGQFWQRFVLKGAV